MEKYLKKVFHFYRYWISPWFGNACRFYPSCSEYAELAILRFGFGRGGFLALRRLCRCHPFHAGGIDEVPNKDCSSKWYLYKD